MINLLSKDKEGYRKWQGFFESSELKQKIKKLWFAKPF